MFDSLKMPLDKALAVAVIGLVTVITVLAVIACLILLVSKAIRAIESAVSKKSEETAVETATVPSPVASAPIHTGPVLENVDDKEAAVIMAIVSDKSGIPLERLNFRSIKLIGDEKKGEVK